MATKPEYAWCECGHVEKKHNNKGKCLDAFGAVIGLKPCPCKKFRIRKAGQIKG